MTLNIKPNETYIIGEVGLNHNGSLELAKKILIMAHSCGCNAVKFQKRNVDSMTTKDVLDKPFHLYPSLGQTYREVRENLELNIDDYERLIILSELLDLDFIVTPFDLDSLKFILTLNVSGIKIASHSLTDIPLLEEIAKIDLPVILSTGMCNAKDIHLAVDVLTQNFERKKESKNELVILHCISQYPLSVEFANLSFIKELKDMYGDFRIGFSDHENGIVLAPVAIAMGAEILEKHITLDRTLEGFDQQMSLDYYLLSEYISNIRKTEAALKPHAKEVMINELDCYNNYRRTVVSTCEIKCGTKLERWMLTTKEPNIGIQPKFIDRIIGIKTNHDISEDSHIKLTDLEL